MDEHSHRIYYIGSDVRPEKCIDGLTDYAQELGKLMEDRYKGRIDELSVDKIIRQLDAWSFVTIINDKYAGEVLKLYEARSDEALRDLAEDGFSQLIENARTGGVQWF